MQHEFPVSVSIATLRFDGAGGGEKDTYTYRGTVSCDTRYTLTYASEEGKQKTVLSFDRERPERIALVQRGEVECELLFDKNTPHTTLYRVPGVGEMDMKIQTRSVENTEGERTRRIRLDYEATVGGARLRTVMTLTVTEE